MLTREQFAEWIERAQPEAIRYVATILKNRGSTLPKLRRQPDRHNDHVLDFGEEWDIFNAVVLTLLGDQGEDDQGEPLPLKDPPPYTMFPGAPDDFEHFKAWLFNWLENRAKNDGRRERTKRAHEVSLDVDRPRARKAARRLEREVIRQTKRDVRDENRQIEDDNTRRHLCEAKPVEEDETASRDDLLDLEQAWAVLTDFPRSRPDVVGPSTDRVGRPSKWDDEEARATFFEYCELQRALRHAHDVALTRKSDESHQDHVRRVVEILLELDREWVHGPSFSPFAFAVTSQHPNYVPEPGHTRLFSIYDPVYPALTEPAAARIAKQAPARADALARELIAYYRNLRPTQVKAALEKGRRLTPGAARRRPRGTTQVVKESVPAS